MGIIYFQCYLYYLGNITLLTPHVHTYNLTVFMYFQCLRKVGKFIVEQNEMVYLPRGLLLTNPAERGLRIVSF